MELLMIINMESLGGVLIGGSMGSTDGKVLGSD